jgi:alkylation response protein AidB-like acyl-CoA dehydrogenase
MQPTQIQPTQPSAEPLIDVVKRFVQSEVLPVAAGKEGDTPIPPALIGRMKALGLFGTIIPREYGGLGLSMPQHVALIEEIARGWLSMAGVLNPHVLCCHLLLTSGTERQRGELLPRMASGELRAAISLSEPQAGADLQAIEAHAEPVGEDLWSLSGHKRWITNGLSASLVFVLVKTDARADPPHKGMTCFITEKAPSDHANKGLYARLSITEEIDKMGDRGVETTNAVYDDYRCHTSRILGEGDGLNRGFALIMRSMEAGRIGASALCVGVAQRCFDLALRYAVARKAFGGPIANQQAIQFKLADMATKIQAARLLTLRAAEMKEAGARGDLEAGMAKLFATDAAVEVAQEAFRIHGANGYSKAYEIERLLRDVLSLVSAEGPAEIQRMIIGRSLVQAETHRHSG